MNEREAQEKVSRLLPARKGHFRLESGHHGELWLDLELLCLRPEPVRRLAARLARRLARHRIEIVCGPLIEGAFVGLMVALEMGVTFTYTERFAEPYADALFPVQYRLPRTLRDVVRGKQVGIVNDVINAGSAIRGTLADLHACGAEPVAMGALAVLGGSAAKFAAERKIPLETLLTLPNQIWTPAECPMCVRGIQLEDPLGSEPRS